VVCGTLAEERWESLRVITAIPGLIPGRCIVPDRYAFLFPMLLLMYWLSRVHHRSIFQLLGQTITDPSDSGSERFKILKLRVLPIGKGITPGTCV
jgi:hypothetical protein